MARRHERTHSTRRLIRAGVPQGSALSPLLYSAYTNDIPRPTSGVQLALFADDTALFYRNRYRDVAASRLQRAIDELGQWFRLWRIESVTLDRNLNFRDHIARVRKTALFYTARLGALLGRKSKLSRRNKRTIYKMCIRTVMTYASPVFAHAAPKTLEKLQLGHRLSSPLHPPGRRRPLPAGRDNGTVRDGSPICRDDSLQESSIEHVTRRRHCTCRDRSPDSSP
ncbi:Probable RNA-directed DNA polymerase from transposon BS [Eumeta japonica]|uniref:Probable RNA-directed DNA polymerase from transposon BS n=1 Tax=Eumeta variegata TaxID=151549 RepID=A0A4C1Z0Q0_EUMVA|nr:Probable RNA-directed DNA polymerase from transposon BS [Eumeta japonica]